MSADLRDRLDEALERIRQLEEELRPSKLMHFFPHSWALPMKEATLLAMIVARSPLPTTRASLFNLGWQDSELESDKIIDIYLSKIRTSLRRVGMPVVLRHHGAHLGWSFSKQDADLLRAICDAERNGAPPNGGGVTIAHLAEGAAGYLACSGSIMSVEQLELVIDELRRAASMAWPHPTEERRTA